MKSRGGKGDVLLHFVPISALGIHSLDCKLASISKRLDDWLGSQYTGDTLIYIETGRIRTHQIHDKLHFQFVPMAKRAFVVSF